MFIANFDNVNMNDLLSRNDINKIYKLAGHMGIKLPRKSTNSYSSLGRSPLIETFRNHRSLMIIKEQMVRFLHRVLNSENGISNNFFQCVIMGSNF